MFGAETTTDDAEGEVTRTAPMSDDLLSPMFAKQLLADFVGELDQVPPAFSAISVDGVRSYKRARAGEDVELPARTIEVYSADLVSIDAVSYTQLTEEEVQTGSAEVRDTFRVPKAGTIAGCMVTEGEISRDDKVRVVRDGVVLFDGSFGSMRRFKDDVNVVKRGYECGLGIEKFQDIKVGDILEAYKIVEVARTE